MNVDKTMIQSCYKMIQDILRDAFNIPALLFTPPYGDFKQIDQGMRAAVWTKYDMADGNHFFSETNTGNRIIIVKSNLGFYNILATLSAGTQPEFISVGPFRDNELSAHYFSQILKESHIAPNELQRTKSMYERLPFAQTDAVVNVMRRILEYFFPDFQQITPEYLHFSEQKKKAVINTELLDLYSVDYSEKYRSLLFDFLHYISIGNNPAAKEALQVFLQETAPANSKNMSEYKMTLQRVNEYCHLTLLGTSIHPLHTLQQVVFVL